jgi:adenosylhomocysteine nucleosidase
MKRLGIIAAMPVELENLVKILGAEELNVKGFYKIFKCDYKGIDIHLACSGIGKVNAAACTQKLIDVYEVEAIINMGIAGAISQTLHTLDIVIGNEVVYHDFHPAELLDRYHPFSRNFKCDTQLIEIAQISCKNILKPHQFTLGRIASGDCFVEDNSIKTYIRDQLEAICCEMEGCSVGHTAYLNDVPFLVLRSISDLADDDAEMSYSEFEQKAAIQANNIVFGMLDSIKNLNY